MSQPQDHTIGRYGAEIDNWAFHRRERRLVAIGVLIGWAVLALVGCSDRQNPRKAVRVLEGQRLTVGIPEGSPLAPALEDQRGEWEQQTGAIIQLSEHPWNAISKDATTAYQTDNRPDDVLIYPPWALGELAERDALQPLPPSLLEDPDVAWDDYFLALRNHIRWDDETLALPLGTPVLVCYYRQDLLSQHGLQPPQSWEDYFRIAEEFTQRATSTEEARRGATGGLSTRATAEEARTPDGPPAAVAEPLGQGWRRVVFLSRAASYAKHPNNFSFFFNLQTMDPLIATEGFARALEDLIRARDLSSVDDATRERIDRWIAENDLNRYGDPKDTMYAGGTPLFDEATGRRIDRYRYILRKHPELSQALSFDVIDARRAVWEGRAALALAWETPGMRTAHPATTSLDVLCVPLPGSRQVFDGVRGQWEEVAEVNRPTFFGFAGYWVSVHRRSPNLEAAFDFLRYISQVGLSPTGEADPEWAPYRNDHLQSPLQWTSPGVPIATAQSYVQAVGASFASDDVVLDLCIPGSRRYMEALDEGLARALQNQAAPQEALEQVADEWRQITKSLGAQSQRRAYQRSLGLPVIE